MGDLKEEVQQQIDDFI